MRGTIICVKIIINTSLIFMLSAAIETKRPAYRIDYRYEKAFGAFYKLHYTAVDWHHARVRCEAEAAELVVPESLDEAEALMLVISPSLNKFEGVFIGVHDIYAEGLFVTINGDFFANTFLELLWEQLQPKHGGGRCVAMRRNGKLFVHDCLNRLPFVCKKKASEIVFYPDCLTFDKKWVLGPNKTCYMTHIEQQTWYDAFDTCAGAGGHLVTLDSKNETDYIASLFNQVFQPVTEDDFAFLGFNDFFIRFHYRTVFGNPLNSQPADWDIKCADEKDFKDVEKRCGGLTRSGLLATRACDTPAVFFCEKPANDSSAVQIYTTTTSAKKSLATTKTDVSKEKLRNLDLSHALKTVALGTTQPLEKVRVHGNESIITVPVLTKSDTTNTPHKTVEDLRNFYTTLAVEVVPNVDNILPKIQTDSVIEDTILPAVNSDSVDIISTTLTKDSVNEDTLRKLRTVLVDEYTLSPILQTYSVHEHISPTIKEDLVDKDISPTLKTQPVDEHLISLESETYSVGEDKPSTVETHLIDKNISQEVYIDDTNYEYPTANNNHKE